MTDALEELKRERDEARAEVARLKAFAAVCHQHDNHAHQTPDKRCLTCMQDEVERLKAEAAESGERGYSQWLDLKADNERLRAAIQWHKRHGAEKIFNVGDADRELWAALEVKHGNLETPPCAGCGTIRADRSACPGCKQVFCRECAEEPYSFCCDGEVTP